MKPSLSPAVASFFFLCFSWSPLFASPLFLLPVSSLAVFLFSIYCSSHVPLFFIKFIPLSPHFFSIFSISPAFFCLLIMRISRRKQFKRVMRFYSVGFGIKEPFKVLVDGTFLTAALKHRLSLADQLPLLLGGQCSILVTPCIVSELRQLPREKSIGAIAACKRLRRFHCKHDLDDARRHLVSMPENEENGEGEDGGEREEGEEGEEGEAERFEEQRGSEGETANPQREKFSLHPALAAFRARQEEELLGTTFSSENRGVSRSSGEKGARDWKEESEATPSGTVFCADAFRCICRVIGQRNSPKLCVATQDRRLREKLRAVPGVPLIFLYKGGILQLEPPTSKTRAKHELEEKKKLRMGKEERRLFHETRRRVKAQNAGAPAGTASSPSSALRGAEKKKKKARKGVNPLSCKKSQKTVVNAPPTKAKKTRSRRKKGSGPASGEGGGPTTS
ncbi:putative U3 snoRNP, related protein [Toxoplasma gondii ARI]|uniref:Putative U3 snoRNP, related protein n=1 Tax=Toxoplasma gondii ARI TaxID=1074872 RepID=A0A139Y1T2_TOXGO|nr:putative U3 snoRNP, related protein [Toxoplasma gondii ARI]